MMYSNKLAAAIKVAGKVLREQGDKVFLPFGSEYSIYLRNYDHRRALVSIEIDGTDIANHTQFILPANGTLEIERFVKDNTKGNRFKFIERTAGVEAHRGVKAEDGIVQISFQFEAFPVYTARDLLVRGHYDTYDTASPYRGLDYRTFGLTNEVSGMLCSNVSAVAQNATGITAPGSVSNQKFTQGAWFPVETTKHTLVFQMLGETETTTVQQPVYVRQKNKCVSCGHTNDSHAKFCSQCGTGLEIV